MRFGDNGIKNISVALNKVIAEVKDVNKNSEGFGYKYATLDEVLKTIRPLLAKNGLSLIQSQEIDREAGFVVVKTLLTHISGEWLETKAEAPVAELKGMNSYQSIGAGITYLRRYAISSLFAISSEEDTDAAEKYPSPKKQTQKSQPQPQADEKSLEALGIVLEEKDGFVKAVEKVKGAIYQNREVLKQLGFKFSKDKKVWYKKLETQKN